VNRASSTTPVKAALVPCEAFQFRMLATRLDSRALDGCYAQGPRLPHQPHAVGLGQPSIRPA
jgi:hypothetical protein